MRLAAESATCSAERIHDSFLGSLLGIEISSGPEGGGSMASTLSKIWRWFPACLALLVLLKTPAPSAQTLEKAPDLRCEVYCSRDKIRTAKARIFWVGAQMPLGQSKLKSLSAPVTEIVEATVYKKGFDQNFYASLDARSETRPGSEFRTAAPQMPALPGLSLKLTEFKQPKLTTEQRRAFEQRDALSRPAPAAVAAQETWVEVEGLKPGLNYQWRVRFKGPNGEQQTGIATCIAPTCPADLKQ